MRKFLTTFAALFVIVGLMIPAYADGTAPGEFAESQQYVYLAQGANLYLGPDESYDVYSNAETAYNQKILISGVYANGWAKYFDANGNQWLYVASGDIIWDNTDAYTKADYDTDSASGVSNPGYYSESQQYVYLAQGANLYLGPDTSYDVYSTAYEEYNLEVIVSDVYENGWARYKTSTDSALWLYVAPEDIIREEENAYTKEEYLLSIHYVKGLGYLTIIAFAVCVFLLFADSVFLEITCAVLSTGIGAVVLYILYNLYTSCGKEQITENYAIIAILLGLLILNYLLFCLKLTQTLKKRKQTLLN